MDLKQYFTDLNEKEAELKSKHADNIVHVTSLFYRERNSTPGTTASANCRNAARVITDGTHREATEDEVAAFYDRQDEELKRNIKSEQTKKQQYVIVTGGASVEPVNATVVPAQRGRRQESKPVEE